MASIRGGTAHPGFSSACLSCPRCSLVVTTGKEVRPSHSGVKSVGVQIERAQPHGALQAHNGIRVLAQIHAQTATHAPRQRQIRVQSNSAIYVDDAAFGLSGQIAQASATEQQRDRIIHADGYRAARQPYALRDFTLRIGQPAVRQADGDAPGPNP